MGMSKALKKYSVSTELAVENAGNELSDTFYHNCMFCEKLVKVSSNNFESCRRLGGGKFYCPFCLRNDFHYRSSKNVLIVSYRAIFAQYYHQNYLDNEPDSSKRLWLSDIKDMISNHERTGLNCPVFSYDPTTYLWFIDFNKIGSDSRKAPILDVQSTAMAILCSFRMSDIYGLYALEDMWKKFDKAIVLFYENRQRPDNRRMLIPTLNGIVHGQNANKEDRNFVPSMLRLK
jgi:hypothetical protein